MRANFQDSLDIRFQLTHWCHHYVGGTVLVRAIKFQHDIASAAER